MSRAFTKERDDVIEPVVDSHSPGVPVRVTVAGRAKLEARRAQPQSAAEQLRLDHLWADLIVVAPPEDRSRVAFGATIDVRSAGLGARRYTLVGSEEADVAAGLISEASPLGVALLGARVGDVVLWRRPVGDVELAIETVSYEDAMTSDQRRPT